MKDVEPLCKKSLGGHQPRILYWLHNVVHDGYSIAAVVVLGGFFSPPNLLLVSLKQCHDAFRIFQVLATALLHSELRRLLLGLPDIS